MEEIGAHNRDRFDAPASVHAYEQVSGLSPCEQAMFDAHVRPGARIIDLGVGTGRTTDWLAQRGSSYLGIDIAPAMVEAARRRHPGIELRVGDAADLQDVPDGSVDAVVFSYNGIDYLDDADRLRALAEVRRVLAPAGRFVFSTHNPRAIVAPLPATTRPLPHRLAVAALVTGRRTIRQVPSRAFCRGEGWILDPVKGGLQTHEATPGRVTAELARAGLAVIEVRGGDHPARPSTLRTPWWYYACQVAGS